MRLVVFYPMVAGTMLVIDPYDRHEPQHITIRGGSSVPLRAERAHVRGRPGRLLSQLYGLRALARAACSEFGSFHMYKSGRKMSSRIRLKGDAVVPAHRSAS